MANIDWSKAPAKKPGASEAEVRAAGLGPFPAPHSGFDRLEVQPGRSSGRSYASPDASQERTLSPEAIADIEHKLGYDTAETMRRRLEDPGYWAKTQKVSYEIWAVRAQPGQPLHNKLEDADYVTSESKDIVLSGTVGEQWPVTEGKLGSTYTAPDGSELDPAQMQDWTRIKTKADGKPTAFAIRVPGGLKDFPVQTSWGETLYANSSKTPGHGTGDYILASIGEDGKPNLQDMWVVNHDVFVTTYDMTNFAMETQGSAVAPPKPAGFAMRPPEQLAEMRASGNPDYDKILTAYDAYETAPVTDKDDDTVGFESDGSSVEVSGPDDEPAGFDAGALDFESDGFAVGGQDDEQVGFDAGGLDVESAEDLRERRLGEHSGQSYHEGNMPDTSAIEANGESDRGLDEPGFSME